MNIAAIAPGKNPPEEINVFIEIPAHSSPVKYELDKDSGVLCVDRFMTTAMFYPCNYGFVPQTLSEDGDPVDVLVMTPVPLIHGSLIRCRAIGMLQMQDEAGNDNKVLAVPVAKLSPSQQDIKSYTDLPQVFLSSIEHFFEHYKDLEVGKWVKTGGWFGVAEAHKEIMDSIERYNKD